MVVGTHCAAAVRPDSCLNNTHGDENAEVIGVAAKFPLDELTPFHRRQSRVSARAARGFFLPLSRRSAVSVSFTEN